MNVSLERCAFLGAGGYGRVFKVKHNTTEIIYALKIVLFSQNEKTEAAAVRQLVELEYQKLEKLAGSPRVVNVETHSLRVIMKDEFELGAGYLMCDVGTPVLPANCYKRNKLTKTGKDIIESLFEMQSTDGIAHGDARIHNVVWDSIASCYKWLDFMGSSSDVNKDLRDRKDLSLLLNTMLPDDVKVAEDKIEEICSFANVRLKVLATESAIESLKNNA